MTRHSRIARTIAMALVGGLVTESALAYVGPGAGLSAIGTLLALVGAVVLALVGFLWYPIKRLMSRLRDRRGRLE